MNNNWQNLLKEETDKEYFKALQESVKNRRDVSVVYPPEDLTFSAFSMPPENIKVVIIGQDPYHGPGQAHGMSFSVLPGIAVPRSLKNIYKEIALEFGYIMPTDNGYLLPWAEQGVFLLNGVLTVEQGKPNSHEGFGWEVFTDKVIEVISQSQEDVVFMLWGLYAIKKARLIDASKHLVLQSPHPSPFSARKGFFGNNHFKLANEYLSSKGKAKIDWRI